VSRPEILPKLIHGHLTQSERASLSEPLSALTLAGALAACKKMNDVGLGQILWVSQINGGSVL